MTRLAITYRLTQLRSLMRKHQLDYYFVPSSDPHQNEYVPVHWQRRQWISNFTGSSGDVLISKDKAYLWTDGRYFLQAERELDTDHYTLMKHQQGVVARIDEWLVKNAQGQRIGVDPRVMNITQTHKWQAALVDVNSELVSIEENLIDAIWEEQPVFEHKPITLWEEEYAGLSADHKINDLRQLGKLNIDAHVISALDAIAWLFNIRGQDIEFNPLVISNAIITQNEAKLYLDINQLTDHQRHYFSDLNISLYPYTEFQNGLNELRGSVLLDPNMSNWWIKQQLTKAKLIFKQSPITLAKACKNDTELKGMKEAHRRDAIAVCKFLCWLENNWQGEDELSADNKLSQFRHQNPHLQSLSFSTISAFGPHAAIVHYSVTETSKLSITDQNLYLIDSGGQYLEGTTDITRTLHLGIPSQQQKHHYTLVLKGHLALRHLTFPANTLGEYLNAIARLALWNEGLDFNHGVGHGVGSYLCVHEGPQRISAAPSGIALQPGMVISNEPGFYLEHQYGIRIENLCYVKQTISSEESLSGHGPFYQLDDLTFVPYARKLIKVDELSQQEINWINRYHYTTYELLKNALPDGVREWLIEATAPL